MQERYIFNEKGYDDFFLYLDLFFNSSLGAPPVFEYYQNYTTIFKALEPTRPVGSVTEEMDKEMWDEIDKRQK
jgi:hypothetical protein